MTSIMLQTRADWNARPPTSVVRLNWSKVTKFIVHYSGASREQSVRSIQNFCMDNKGHSDIDYNELIRGALLYVGRGNNVGSHTLNNNSTSYGVCVIGQNGDASADDLNVVRMRYEYACAMAGRKLTALGHNQAPTLPPGYTDCPGSQIQAWINAGMPYLDGETDMTFGLNDEERLAKMFHFSPTANLDQTGQGDILEVPNEMVQHLMGIESGIADLVSRPPVTSAPIDQDALNAAVAAALSNPVVVAAIATAVVDEDHRRSAE